MTNDQFKVLKKVEFFNPFIIKKKKAPVPLGIAKDKFSRPYLHVD